MEKQLTALRGNAAGMAVMWQALRLWGRREWVVAFLAAVGTALMLGLPTVLIPNSFFHRDIEPTWWSYPVWILTAVLTGMLTATYLRQTPSDKEKGRDKTSTLGMIGAFSAWFAVGCPVCNKIALLLLGYSGALTYFAPVQPLLAVVALVLVGVALWMRLKGQVYCPVA